MRRGLLHWRSYWASSGGIGPPLYSRYAVPWTTSSYKFCYKLPDVHLCVRYLPLSAVLQSISRAARTAFLQCLEDIFVVLALPMLDLLRCRSLWVFALGGVRFCLRCGPLLVSLISVPLVGVSLIGVSLAGAPVRGGSEGIGSRSRLDVGHLRMDRHRSCTKQTKKRCYGLHDDFDFLARYRVQFTGRETPKKIGSLLTRLLMLRDLSMLHILSSPFSAKGSEDYTCNRHALITFPIGPACHMKEAHASAVVARPCVRCLTTIRCNVRYP